MSREHDFPLKTEQQEEEEEGEHGDLVLCQQKGVVWLPGEEVTVRLYDSLWRNYNVSQRDYHYG